MLQQMTMTATTAAPWVGRIGGGAGFADQARRMRLVTETTERRRGLRVHQARPVKVLDAAGGRTLVGETVDVSATGLRVTLPAEAALRVGEILGIHVGLSRVGERLANRRPVVPVRVVWVGKARGRKVGLLAGVEFATGIGAQLDAA